MSGLRVRFLTQNDTIEPSAASGCDGFPFPTPPYPVDPPDNHPIELSLAEAIRWYYRIKEWEYSTDLVTTGQKSDGTPTHYNLSGAGTMNALNPPATELELVYHPGVAFGHDFRAQNVQTGQDFGFGPDGVVTTTVDLSFMSGPVYRIDPGGMTPPIILPDLVISASIVGRIDDQDHVLLTVNVNLDDAHGLVARVDNNTVSTFYKGVDSDDPTVRWVATGSTLDFNPHQYWEYADENGNAIYNSSTGAVLPGRHPYD